MLLLELRRAPPDQPQALIEEARRRARMRRWRRAALGALVLGAAAALGYGVSGGGGPGVVARSGTVPFVNLRAFAGRGELAFVSRGVAWALDGDGGTLRRLPDPAGWTASQPILSHDGRWLAYLTAASTLVSPTTAELWIAHGDGSGAHVVRGLEVGGLVGWNPRADVLAVTGGTVGSTLELIRPQGSARTVVALPGGFLRKGLVESATWSPDGRQIAVSTDGAGGGTVVRTYPIAGGAPTTWFRVGNGQLFSSRICSGCGGSETLAYLVGWWPHRGIGFWVLCCGATRNLDQTPLALIARPGARPRVFAQTLSTGTTFVAAGAGGALAIDATAGGAGRVLGQGKTVEHCDARTLECTPVPGATTWVGPDAQRCPAPTARGPSCSIAIAPAGQPGSGVSLDPAWSPDGTSLAYVRAPVLKCISCSDATWDAAHAIYVWNARTGATRRIGSVDGASVPTWSSDGRDLLFVREDGLWLQKISGGAAIEIEHPLFASDALTGPDSVDYFGQIPWPDQFSWWSS